MATISTDTFLDGGTARTAGESWTIQNSATLTVRTDTRWHANAPTGMTGSLGTVLMVAASGGGIFVDARNVRWMPFDSGSGVVPAIGTTVSQGGVSGYLLGVWPSLTSAPTAVGAAMPTAGFLKFREVTGGTFSSGALTGIGASATSADVTGWIEVAVEGTWTGGILGTGVVFRGDWFYLGETTGTPGQILQVPTNGGGSGTHCSAVEIETAPGSGVFEWYPAMVPNGTTRGFHVNVLGTDIRSKFVQYLGNGQVRIGSDGTNNVGFTPASGCKIRVPNIFLRGTSSANRTVNLSYTSPTSRVNCGAGTYSKIDIEFVDTNASISGAGAGHTRRYVNCAIEGSGVIGLTALTPGFANNVCLGANFAYANSESLNINGNNGCVASKIKAFNASDSVVCAVTGGTGFTVSDLEVGALKVRTSSATHATVAGSLTITNLSLIGTGISFNGANNVNVYNTDYCDRFLGTTNSTGGQAVFSLGSAGATNLLIEGLTFGKNGSIDGVHPYGALIANSASASSFVTMQNIGTRQNPLSCGSSASDFPQGLFSGAIPNFTGKRIYVAAKRSGTSLFNASQNLLLENVYFGANPWTINHSSNGRIKGCFNTSPSTASTAFFDCNYLDFFISDTAGRVLLYCSGPEQLQGLVESSFGPKSGFNASGGISFIDDNTGYVIFEMPYFAIGHTGFVNASPSLGYTGSLPTLEYQIDTGSGWNGTWLVLNGANLSSHTIDPTTGFKLKVKVLSTSTSASTFTSILLQTTTSLAAQTDNLYPLSTATLSFEGLQPGSEVRAYVGTDPATAVEIGGVESTSGSIFSFTHSAAGQQGYIMIFALGYQPIIIPRTYQSTDSTLLIQQVVDRNYVNP